MEGMLLKREMNRGWDVFNTGLKFLNPNGPTEVWAERHVMLSLDSVDYFSYDDEEDKYNIFFTDIDRVHVSPLNPNPHTPVLSQFACFCVRCVFCQIWTAVQTHFAGADLLSHLTFESPTLGSTKTARRRAQTTKPSLAHSGTPRSALALWAVQCAATHPP